MIAFDKFLPVYFFSETEKPVVTIGVKWKNVYLNQSRDFFFWPVLNHIYTTAALLDSLSYIHSYSLCSCSRSWRGSDIVMLIKYHLVMTLIIFRSWKLKTVMDFQRFWLTWRSTWETESWASLHLKSPTWASQLRCYREAIEQAMNRSYLQKLIT